MGDAEARLDAAAVPPLGNRVHESCVREHAEVPADRVRVQVDALGELIRVQALVLAPQSLEDRASRSSSPFTP